MDNASSVSVQLDDLQDRVTLDAQNQNIGLGAAQNIGIQTGLVLSGVTSKRLVESWDPEPTFIADNAAEILEMII